jgi:hypothetical protein
MEPICGIQEKIRQEFMSSKTTEIYTHVSTKSIGKIKSRLDTLRLKEGVISDKI